MVNQDVEIMVAGLKSNTGENDFSDFSADTAENNSGVLDHHQFSATYGCEYRWIYGTGDIFICFLPRNRFQLGICNGLVTPVEKSHNSLVPFFGV